MVLQDNGVMSRACSALQSGLVRERNVTGWAVDPGHEYTVGGLFANASKGVIGGKRCG